MIEVSCIETSSYQSQRWKHGWGARKRLAEKLGFRTENEEVVYRTRIQHLELGIFIWHVYEWSIPSYMNGVSQFFIPLRSHVIGDTPHRTGMLWGFLVWFLNVFEPFTMWHIPPCDIYNSQVCRGMDSRRTIASHRLLGLRSYADLEMAPMAVRDEVLRSKAH